MSYALSNTLSVAARVLRQIARDKRFVAITVLMPVVEVYILFAFFDGVDAPIFDPPRFVIPVGALIVHFITYALSAIVLVRERTGHTLGRMFISGYRQIEIIIGYLLAYSILATIQGTIVLVGLNAAFELNYALEIFLSIYLIFWMLAIISIALGIFISNFARSEGQVMPTIPLVIMLSIFLSGAILPIEKLPEWLQWAGGISPMYYANISLQELIGGGVLSDNLTGLIGLPLYGLAVLALAALTLREQD